jgi:hypothetical protein
VEFAGTVQNGVIVLDNTHSLPEGTKVKILVDTGVEPCDKTTLRERLLRLSGTVDDLPPDMARNHDHYIHGARKK